MIYLDNSATTKPFQEVVEAFHKVSIDFFGNPSSLHKLGGIAEQLISQARNQIAEILDVKSSEILFTSGGTEGNNLAIKGTAIKLRSRGRHIITTRVEHASVREACIQLEHLGFQITYIPVDRYGRVKVEDIEKAIRKDTILVSVIHVNNEVGTIQPVKEISEMLKAYPKILFHVDHVQGVGKVPLLCKEWGIDLATISAHKFHGLKGTGVLYIREGVSLSPLFSGGSQEGKQRSGTENVPGIVAMAKALRLTVEDKQKKIRQLEIIQSYFRSQLQEMERVHIHTPTIGAAPHILNFSIKGFKGEVFVHALEDKDVFVSTTSACSSKNSSPSQTLLAMGIQEKEANGAIRISFSFENTLKEAEQACEIIKQVIIELGEVM